MKILRKSIIVALIALSLASIWFGAYLPFAKGRRYIESMQMTRNTRSMEDLQKAFRHVLDFKAPLSDDEVVKFIGSEVVSIVASGRQEEAVSRGMIEFIEGYSDLNDINHLLQMARAYQFLWIQTKKEGDMLKAKEYYQKILERGPKLPPALYGLLDMHRVSGDVEGVKEMGRRILELWPEDTRVVELLNVIEG